MFLDKIGSSNWRARRRIIVVTLVWCGGLITYLVIWGRPISLSETAVNAGFLLMGSIIGSYVFGAVWDDKAPASVSTTEIKSTVVQPTPPAPTEPIE